MPSLRVLSVLLVVLVLVPAVILGWLGWRGAAAWEDAERARIDAEVADGVAAIREAAANAGQRVEAEVGARMEALATVAARALPRRGIPDGMMAVVEAASGGDGPSLYDLRLLDAEGRALWPIPFDPDRPASEAPEARLRFDLVREADRLRFGGGGVDAARAFWEGVNERASTPCLRAWARGQAALLFEPGETRDWLGRFRELEAGTRPAPEACTARVRALLLIEAAGFKDVEAAAVLRRRWRDGTIAETPLTRAERERAEVLAARRAPDGSWCPSPLSTLPWGKWASVEVDAPLPGGARLAARLRADEVRRSSLGDVVAHRFANLRVEPLALALEPGQLRSMASSGLAVLRLETAFGVPGDVMHHHVRREPFEAGRARRRALTVGGILALLAVMGVGLALVRRAVVRERAAGRLRDAFVANVSHELRTPLASVLLHADLMTEPGVDDAKRRHLVSVVRAEGARLGRLVEDLLDFEALASGRRSLEVEPVDLAAAVDAAVLPYRTLAEREGVTLEVEGGADEVVVLADPQAVGRILANLLSNAWRHGRPSRDGAPGRLRVTCLPGDGEIEVVVADDGPGIASEEREAVFERFRRGRGTASVRGTGLGRALARDLARAMGGDLLLRVDGAETAFVLRLPSWAGPEEGEA